MAKPILTIENQIEHLKNEKNIVFHDLNEEEQAKIFLTKYNYLNVVSLKYLYGTGKSDDGKHQYSVKTKFKDIRKKYLELLKFELKLREAVLNYETELKVHFTMFLLAFLQQNKITFEDFLNNLFGDIPKKENDNLEYFYGNKGEILGKNLKVEWKKNIEKYSPIHVNWNLDYHLSIKILSLGKLSEILNCDYGNKGEKVHRIFTKQVMDFSIPSKYKILKSIGILRNALCHKESLIIFLEKGERQSKLSSNTRGINYLRERKDAINFIYAYSKLGKRSLKSDSWVMKFEKYRLQNQSEHKFNKLKINL